MRFRIPPTVVKLVAASLATVVVGLILAFLAGVWHRKVPPVPAVEPREALGGATVEVRVLKVPQVETAVGTIKPVHEAGVASKLLAKVLDVRVRPGQAVAAGDLLVQLDDADLQARRKQAEAATEAAGAAYENARLEFERAQQLREQNAIAQAEVDRAAATLRATKADVDRTREAVREAAVVLEFATITAPIAGTVIERRIEPGDTVSPGQVLVTLYDPNRMQMVASVRESLALQLTVGQQIPARLETLDHECLATVSEIVPEAEATTRSFTVKVTGPCPPGVYSGMFGRIMLPLGDEEVVVVPAAAVRRVGQLTMVDVAEGAATVRRSIQLGRAFGDDREVLAGLRPGEKVVLAGERS